MFKEVGWMVVRKRILIVDDDKEILFVWRNALGSQSAQYEVISADSAMAALNQIRKCPFDLVITDLRMPGIDGQELTSLVKALRPGAVIFWLTAYHTNETDLEAHLLGVDRILDKPLEIAEMRQVVGEALAGQNQPSGTHGRA